MIYISVVREPDGSIGIGTLSRLRRRAFKIFEADCSTNDANNGSSNPERKGRRMRLAH